MLLKLIPILSMVLLVPIVNRVLLLPTIRAPHTTPIHHHDPPGHHHDPPGHHHDPPGHHHGPPDHPPDLPVAPRTHLKILTSPRKIPRTFRKAPQYLPHLSRRIKIINRDPA